VPNHRCHLTTHHAQSKGSHIFKHDPLPTQVHQVGDLSTIAEKCLADCPLRFLTPSPLYLALQPLFFNVGPCHQLIVHHKHAPALLGPLLDLASHEIVAASSLREELVEALWERLRIRRDSRSGQNQKNTPRKELGRERGCARVRLRPGKGLENLTSTGDSASSTPGSDPPLCFFNTMLEKDPCSKDPLALPPIPGGPPVILLSSPVDSIPGLLVCPAPIRNLHRCCASQHTRRVKGMETRLL
jgi:hypothetical protein